MQQVPPDGDIGTELVAFNPDEKYHDADSSLTFDLTEAAYEDQDNNDTTSPDDVKEPDDVDILTCKRNTDGKIESEHPYAESGLYRVGLKLVDDDTGMSTIQALDDILIVSIDREDGKFIYADSMFEVPAGSFDIQPGMFPEIDEKGGDITGDTDFDGEVTIDSQARYENPDDPFPKGQLQFEFKYKIDDKEITVKFEENTDEQEWLVENGNRAFYQGTGKMFIKDEITGIDTEVEGLRYTVALIDGTESPDANGFGGDGHDSIRVLIQKDNGNGTFTTIFDNQRNPDTSSPPRDTNVNTVTGEVTQGEVKFESQ